jgi:hypothetical protein
MVTSPSTQYSAVELPDLSLSAFQATIRRVETAIPDAAIRIRRGAHVLFTSRILETDQAGAYLVASSTPGLFYRATTVRCTCPDATQRRVVCKHSWALTILQSARIDARDAALGIQSPPALLPRPSLDPDQPIPYTLTPAGDAALDTPEPVPAA